MTKTKPKFKVGLIVLMFGWFLYLVAFSL